MSNERIGASLPTGAGREERPVGYGPLRVVWQITMRLPLSPRRVDRAFTGAGSLARRDPRVEVRLTVAGQRRTLTGFPSLDPDGFRSVGLPRALLVVCSSSTRPRPHLSKTSATSAFLSHPPAIMGMDRTSRFMTKLRRGGRVWSKARLLHSRRGSSPHRGFESRPRLKEAETRKGAPVASVPHPLHYASGVGATLTKDVGQLSDVQCIGTRGELFKPLLLRILRVPRRHDVLSINRTVATILARPGPAPSSPQAHSTHGEVAERVGGAAG